MTIRKLYILAIALLLAMLGGSILLNLLLFNRAKRYYFEVNETRLDPVGLSYYPVNIQEVIKTDRIRAVFFGDSRAASWTSPNISSKYEFSNRGIGSQTSVQAIERFSAHVSPLKPHIIIIQIGVNDLKTIALFPERRKSIVTNVQANIKRIVEESKKLGAIAIVTTIFPVGEVPLERKPFWSDDVSRAVQETNAYIATLADEKTIVFDAFSILADRQGLVLQQYRTDELHLNDRGYAALNKKLVSLISTIEPKRLKN
jgi:lysophospholipase L1-like esterase